MTDNDVAEVDAEEEMSLSQAHALMAAIAAQSQLEPGERDVVMVRRYADGWTLEAIGADAGLTRERVRQIINKSQWPMPDLKRARALVAEEEARERAAADEKRVLDWSADHPGAPVDDAVKELRLSRTLVNRYLGARKGLHRGRRHSNMRQRWTDDEIIAMLQQFFEETGSTVSKEFDRWSLARGGPSRQTPTNRFGKWYRALEAAGISASSYTVDRTRRHTNEDMWAAIVAYFATERDSYSFDSFQQWTAAVPGMPSASLIRIRIGKSWTEMSRTALRIIAGHTEGMDPGWLGEVLRRRDWTATDADIKPVDILKQALADLGPVLTIAEYSQWAKARDLPGGAALVRRAGTTWSRLVVEAGGRVGTRGRRGTIPDGELLEPLVTYLALGNPPSCERYSEWARERRRPVAGTVADRFGGWGRAVDAARAAMR